MYTPAKLVPFPGATPNYARILTAFMGSGANVHSEDCLTLNIWTKGTAGRKRPVLVFFYGGSMLSILFPPYCEVALLT